MMYLVNADHQGLTVLPTHRVLHSVAMADLEHLHKALSDHFHMKSYSFTETDESVVRQRWLRELRDTEPGVHKVGALIKNLDRYLLITLKDAEAYEEMTELPYSSDWKRLDVSILNALILRGIVGLEEEQLAAGTNVEYTESIDEALNWVRTGKMQLALILNPTPLKDIIAIAENDERMPRKSTHFYPKPLSGMVLYPMSSNP